MDWKRTDERAVSQAKNYKKAQAELLDTLQEIDSGRLFRFTGHSSLWDYCLRRLLLSESDTETLIRVARTSQKVPELKKAIQSGELNLTAARKVCSVITPQNKSEWIAKAMQLPQKELEREIVKVNPREKVTDKLKPLAKDTTELHCSISIEVENMIRRVQDLESKRQKSSVTLEETLKQMATLYLMRMDPVEKAGRGREAKRESVASRNIPMQVVHRVNARDKGRCTYRGSDGKLCEQGRFTEIHHLRPFSKGGGHDLQNLVTLCSGHYKAVHLNSA
jgi:hypothetical protein